MRDRLPIRQFLSIVLRIVFDWSETRNPESENCIEYATTPKVSLPEGTKMYQWAVEKVEGIFFTASSTSKTQITKKLLRQYEEAKWWTFDEFVRQNYSVWKIVIHNDISDSSCTSSFYMKKLVCKHVLGILIRLKKVNVPSEAKSVPAREGQTGAPRPGANEDEMN